MSCSSKGFEVGAVYESRDVKGDLILVTLVEPFDDVSEHVAFVWLGSDGPSVTPFLGAEHHFYPDQTSVRRYRRVL